MSKPTLRKGVHSVYLLHAHLIFVTQYRYRIWQGYRFSTLHDLFKKTCGRFETILTEFNGEADHVHLIVNYPPKVALSKLVQHLKGVSSRKLKQHHPEVANRYAKGSLWSPSYFAASGGGAPLETLKAYAQNQDHPQ